MTSDDYRAIIKSLGLTPCRPSFDGKTLHQDRDGHFQQVPDPEFLATEERRSVIEVIKWRMGITEH
jgi:hypothetical protein